MLTWHDVRVVPYTQVLIIAMPIDHVEFAHLHSEGGKHLCGSYYRLRFVFDWVLLKWVAHCTAHEITSMLCSCEDAPAAFPRTLARLKRTHSFPRTEWVPQQILLDH
jgi:hypothetical protein